MEASVFAQQSHVSYLGVGSNLGNRKKNLTDAIALLSKPKNIEITALSSIYETAPQYCLDQPSFLNCALKILTILPPRELLKRCQAIEQKLGKIKTSRYGPRIIDIDILLYDHQIIHEEDLVVPHPEMIKRNFVLTPLMEIEPKLVIFGKKIGIWQEKCSDQAVKIFTRG